MAKTKKKKKSKKALAQLRFIGQSHLMNGMSLEKLRKITSGINWEKQSASWRRDIIEKIKVECDVQTGQ